jgi:hypothetical protein
VDREALEATVVVAKGIRMNRYSVVKSAQFGFEVGHKAGWRDAVGAMCEAMVERGMTTSTIAPILRDMRNAR